MNDLKNVSAEELKEVLDSEEGDINWKDSIKVFFRFFCFRFVGELIEYRTLFYTQCAKRGM